MNETELKNRLAGVPRSIEPPRDLWPDIESRLEPTRRTPWLRSVAAGLAIAVAALATLWSGSELATDQLAQENVNGMPNAGLIYANNIDLQYAGPLRTLASEVSPRTRLDAAGEIELGLRTLNRAAEDIRAAIAEDPDSLYLAELLEATHRKRVRMLKELALAGAEPIESRST